MVTDYSSSGTVQGQQTTRARRYSGFTDHAQAYNHNVKLASVASMLKAGGVKVAPGRSDLQAMKPFPAYLHREEPDKDGAAGINGGPSSTTQALGHTQPKEVEERNTYNAACC